MDVVRNTNTARHPNDSVWLLILVLILPTKRQFTALANNPDILITTPGRLVHLLHEVVPLGTTLRVLHAVYLYWPPFTTPSDHRH